MQKSILIMVMLCATTLYIILFYLNILFVPSTIVIRQCITPSSVAASDDNVIVVLVIVCNRSEALKNIVTDLIRFCSHCFYCYRLFTVIANRRRVFQLL